jgi:hypothetical protein
MQVITKRIQPKVFQPFSLTITVETAEEYRDMSSLFSYYGQIPSVACHVFDERYQRMQTICIKINDALDNEDQY